MKAWKIEYEVEGAEGRERHTTCIESDKCPGASNIMRELVRRLPIDDPDFDAHYDSTEWKWSNGQYDVELMAYEAIPAQRLVRVWLSGGAIHVGDHGNVVKAFYISEGVYARDIADMLYRLGYIVCLQLTDQEWYI